MSYVRKSRLGTFTIFGMCFPPPCSEPPKTAAGIGGTKTVPTVDLAKEPDTSSFVPYAERVAQWQAEYPSWWEQDSMFGGVKNKFIAGGAASVLLLALAARR